MLAKIAAAERLAAAAIPALLSLAVVAVGADAAPQQPPRGEGEIAACCYVDENDILDCENLTFEECLTREPVGIAEKWLEGTTCGTAACPDVRCFGASGYCLEPHPTPGCDDYTCCSNVCRQDEFCCVYEWDDQCVGAIVRGVCELPPRNIECPLALLLSDHDSRVGPFSSAALNKSHEICCYTGGPPVCLGGEDEGITCETNEDCPSGVCGDRPTWVYGALWYKFVATQPSIVIHTCQSSAEKATDSILQLFAPADHTNADTACSTLMPIACSDDGCGFGGKLSHLCAEGLEIGQTYYLLAGAKSYETQGNYRITVDGPCLVDDEFYPDSCHRAERVEPMTPVTGPHPFDLTNAHAECGTDACYPGSTGDLWYEFTSECYGFAWVETCGADGETTLEAYAGCDLCPPLLDQPLACSLNQHCGPGADDARIEFVVARDECYKIRLATNSSAATGLLYIDVSSDCSASYIDYIDPPAGTIDARRPYPPGNPAELMGIDRLLVSTDGSDCRQCWTLVCETGVFGGVNAIEEITQEGDLQTIALKRPLTPWATTKIEYVPFGPPAQGFRVHPGDVDAGGAVDSADELALIEGLYETPELSIYTCDIDHSGTCTPLDLLDWIDGANAPAYDGYTWLDHPVASDSFCP